MASRPPSSSEWAYLTRYQEHEWPDDWTARRDDRGAWESTIDAIGARHGLAARRGPIAPEAGSNLAVVLDDAVVKVFARRNPVWYPREVEAMRLLAATPEARAPRLVAEGEVTHAGRVHPYLVMARIEGTPLRTVWKDLSREELRGVARELAEVVRAVHSATVEGLVSFGTSPEEWVARMRARAALAHDHFGGEMPSAIVDQVDAFLEARLPSLRADFTPTFLHADVVGGNVLVARQDGRWRMTGLVDYGDVEVGPVAYEWVSVCQKALRSDPELIATFFDAYGVASPLQDGSRELLHLHTLLHRFSLLPFVAADHPELDRLEGLLDVLWPG